MASEQTDARRTRVRELWLRKDADIAKILIEEGYGGELARTAPGKKKQLASMQRNVWNDRVALRKEWRTIKRATNADTSETRGEYLAALESLQAEGIDILTNQDVKGTPRVQALMALTRIQEAKAKAQGVAETTADPDESPLASVPFFGVVVDLKKLSPKAKAKIDEWTSGRED